MHERTFTTENLAIYEQAVSTHQHLISEHLYTPPLIPFREHRHAELLAHIVYQQPITYILRYLRCRCLPTVVTLYYIAESIVIAYICIR